MVARVVNLAVGLAMIPLLVHALGGLEFAAWAVLLSASIVFTQLHIGIPVALAFEVAVAVRSKPELVARFWASAAAALTTIHAVCVLLALPIAAPIAAWLRLPQIGGWAPGAVLVCVLACVGIRSVLLTGSAVLLGHFRFREAAGLSLAQAFLSNLAATMAAWFTRDLAATLVAFWSVQLAVAAAGIMLAMRAGVRPAWGQNGVGLARRLCRSGIALQTTEWAQTINFQFDKFVVVRVLGLWPAALYEVANRSALALRSVPASSTESLLPIAAQSAARGSGGAAGTRRLALLAVHGVLIFCAAPWTVAPVFLYAWVGEMGYVSRHVFGWLCLGAAANLIALPVGTLAQAAGHPRLLARAALASTLVNVVLSVSLVHVWGLPGAAFGSCVAIVLGTVMLLREARATIGGEINAAIVLELRRHASLVALCLVWGVVVHAAFDHWILGLPVAVRYGVGLRAMAALVAAGLYAACLLAMLAMKLRLVGLDQHEREFVARLGAAGLAIG
jgi:O-antigen/teichoic acid export membrane protein